MKLRVRPSKHQVLWSFYPIHLQMWVSQYIKYHFHEGLENIWHWRLSRIFPTNELLIDLIYHLEPSMIFHEVAIPLAFLSLSSFSLFFAFFFRSFLFLLSVSQFFLISRPRYFPKLSVNFRQRSEKIRKLPRPMIRTRRDLLLFKWDGLFTCSKTYKITLRPWLAPKK